MIENQTQFIRLKSECATELAITIHGNMETHMY